MAGRSVRGREQEELAAANLAEVFRAQLSGTLSNDGGNRELLPDPFLSLCDQSIEIDADRQPADN
jgi:hypothetical protein